MAEAEEEAQEALVQMLALAQLITEAQEAQEFQYLLLDLQ